VATFATPGVHFDQLHNIVGPLPPSKGYTYMLTCVNHFTPWLEAIPITDSTAETVAQVFVSGWVLKFDIPSVVTTDRSVQFEFSLWQKPMQLLGTKQIEAIQSSNRLVECFHQKLKAYCGVHTTLKQDMGCSSADLVYRTMLRLPGEFFNKDTNDQPGPVLYLSQLKANAIIQQLQPTQV